MRLLAFCLAMAWAGASAGWRQDWRLLGEVGMVQPWGDLEMVVDDALYGNLGLAYAYAPGLEFYAQAGYAYMPVQAEYFAGLHQLNGRAGLQYSPSWLSPMQIGAGLGLVFVRGDSTDPRAVEYMLYDNESEFGWHARLGLPVVRWKDSSVGFRIHWEHIWTKPASQLLWFGLYMEGAPW